jgi:hypothetical protein
MKAHKSNNHTFLWLWSTHATAWKIVLKYLWYIHYVMTNWGIFACSMFLWNIVTLIGTNHQISTFRLQFLHVDYKFVSCNFISCDVDTWVLTTNRPHRLILNHINKRCMWLENSCAQWRLIQQCIAIGASS